MKIASVSENKKIERRVAITPEIANRIDSKVDPLYKAFETSAKAAKDLAKLAGEDRDDLKFKGRLLFQVDKDIPFSLLREVMFNAGQAEFSEFEFVVIQSGN